MAGVPPIPPLLCNTPPPIDFGDEDDDSGLPPTLTLDEDEFGEFALGVDINEDAINVEASSLPRTPLPFELSSSTTSGFTDVAHTLEDCGAISISPTELSISPTHEENNTKVHLNEAFNYNVIQKCPTDTDPTQFNDTVKKLIEKNGYPDIKDTASTLSKVADNNQYSTDSNDAKIATATAVVQIEHDAEKLTRTPEVQEFEKESYKAVQDKDIPTKPNIAPVISQTPPPPLTGLVLLEDLTDDSSDEDCHRSPKKTSVSPISPTASNEDSNSDDFFAIHVVDEPTSPKQDKLSPIAEDINMNNFSKQNNNIINEKNSNLTVVEQQCDDDDFGDFADFESATDFINPATTSPLSTTDFVDNNKNIKVEETPRDDNTPIKDIDDEFDDFQDFTTAPISEPSTPPAISGPKTLNNTAKNETETNCPISVTDSSVTDIKTEAKPFENIDNADDDDDFGDFEEATFAAPSNAQTPHTPILQTQTPLTANGNINERLGTVLKMMFPVEDEGIGDEIQNQIKINVTKELPNLQSPNAKLPFEAIEAAKALEFQWPQSEMRHALIRSIGIDSRNILFGDNWNPSMPRFAANLSFNPLKPMKPQSANNTTPTTYADVDTMSYSGGASSNNANAAESDMNSYAKRTDVPDVEFDWQGAGLVNPLDASYAHTLLLDLDQVMVMATTKLDNLNVDSSSYSFSACATLEHIKIPTTIITTTCTTATTITTANNKLTNQMQRFNVMPINTKTTIPPPALHTSGQLSSSSSLSSLNINNSSTYGNSTPNFSLNVGRNVINTYENNCTYQNLSTNALTPHTNADLNAFHTPYTFATTTNSLVTQNSVVVENLTNNESLIYLKNVTNHFLAINQNHTTSMSNKNMNNNNNNTLNSNSNTRFIMSNPITTQSSSNCLYTPTLIWADFCNNSNMLNKPLECANFHLNSNRLPDSSRVKGEANTRETEAIHPSPPTTRLDTPDDQHQSDTTYTNIDDNISETISKNERQNEMRASPTRDTCPSPLTLDNAAYQFATQDQCINMNVASNSGSSSAASSISNIKSYDNSKTITALRLGANAIVADDDDDDETVVTSTYAGPLKETHIYTPSKTELAATSKAGKSPVAANEPIDFDYEIAAAGIIIDEKVVKKEYRDVEYNPGFSLDVVNEYGDELTLNKTESFGVVSSISALPLTPTQTQQQQPQTASDFDTDEFTEFTEFQSVPPPSAVHAAMPTTDATYGHTMPTSTITSKFPVEHNTKTTLNSLPPVLPAAVTKAKEASNTPSRTNSPSIIDNMILSPAILLPQAIPMNSSNATTVTKAAPTIEWGNSTANINPDELARIEEFYSQPKISQTSKDAANLSQKSTPTHAYAENQTKSSTISISASVALKEQDSTLNDDYWSEFVSVPVAPSQLPNNGSRLNNNNAGSSSNNNNNNKNNNNNNQSIMLSKRMGDLHISNSNNEMRSPRHHHQQQHSTAHRTLTPTPQQKSIAHSANLTNNSNSNSNSNINDDDWSDFVSSTPTPAAASTQHANTYMPAAHAPQFNSAAWQNANFYNNPLGLYHQQATMQMRSLTPQQQQLQLQQQIHIMQDFSTAPISNRPQNIMHNSNNSTAISNMQHSNTYSPLQVGNARIAPSISLIPDLGFVAPALPVHTAFVNVLPKTSFNSKK